MDSISGPKLRLILWKAARAVEEADLRFLNRITEGCPKSHGRCLTDFAVLEILLHKGPLPVNTIGKKVLLTSGSITTAVDRLAKEKLVRRVPSPTDGRAVLVELTPEGHKTISAIFQRHAQSLEQLVSVLEPEEKTVLANLLKKWGKFAESFQDSQVESTVS
jgi:MarR family transcriptional regulator, 2-MHQ and catechol-resistance regulon repressor